MASNKKSWENPPKWTKTWLKYGMEKNNASTRCVWNASLFIFPWTAEMSRRKRRQKCQKINSCSKTMFILAATETELEIMTKNPRYKL